MISRPTRICLVTTGHPSTNPRLVKEADALTEAGYEVRVVACSFEPWAAKADEEFADRPWSVDRVSFGPVEPGAKWQFLRLRRTVCASLVRLAGVRPFLALRALHYVIPELTSMACAEPASLFIAHNLAALPAAARAAQEHRARLGFDAEDFHRGEFPDDATASIAARLTRWAEATYIPRCDYVTAASDGIAEAYTEALSIVRPVTILNAFDNDPTHVLTPDELRAEKDEETFSLYWFSQTVGPDRGIETAVSALQNLPDDVVLAIRGNPRPEYQRQLDEMALRLGVRDRVRWLRTAAPREMIARAGCHDVGLALEPGHTPNNDRALSNKLFTYLEAGIPAVATATNGQRRFAETLSGAVYLIEPGDAGGLTAAVRKLREDREQTLQAVQGLRRMVSWSTEKHKLLDAVAGALGGGAE